MRKCGIICNKLIMKGGNDMNNLTQCKVCGKEIAANAKTCPECGAKNKTYPMTR